ncbi:MAG: polysaccharide pyruvyl transferase family protein [Actinomycetota bacterium]
MKWILWGDILERHVVDSLASALRAEGHDVVHVPVREPGYVLDPDAETERRWEALLDEALPADALFNFRADHLTPRLVEKLRAQGTVTFAWLSDDPLLYQLVYRHFVESYDVTLHTGREDVLAFYEQRHGIKGFSFPFWTDDARYPARWDPDAADIELGFLGNCTGPRRNGRYDLLASLPFRTRFFGRMNRGDEDYAGIAGGLLAPDEISEATARFRLGLSIPQAFDEAEPRFSFPELVGFGEFCFPSRLIAYAATGVPSISLQATASPLASTLTVRTRAELVGIAADLLEDPGALLALSASVRAEFEACLSARSRVAMLSGLLSERRDLDVRTRANLWRQFGESPVSIALRRTRRAVPKPLPQPTETTVLAFLRASGVAPRPIDLHSAGNALGVRIAAFDVDACPTLARNPWGLRAGDGPVEIDGERLERLIERTRARVLLFGDGCAPRADTIERLRVAGTTTVGVWFESPTKAAGAFAMRFDAIATSDPSAIEFFQERGLPPIALPEAASADRSARPPGVLVRGATPGAVALTSRLQAAGIPVTPGPEAEIELFSADTGESAGAVFAAVARGALVIAPARIAPESLDPNGQMLVFENLAQAVGLSAYYAARAAECDEIRAAAARRAAEFGWDHWLSSLLGAIKAPVPTSTGSIAVLGYYGRGNAGDELILAGLAERLPDTDLRVIGYDAAGVAAGHNLPAVNIADLDAARELIAGASAFVIGGGGLIHDYALRSDDASAWLSGEARPRSLAAIALLAATAARAGVPVGIYGIGIGPLETSLGRALARYVAETAAFISVRDEGSAEILRECGFRGDLLVGADPTLTITRPDPAGVLSELTGLEYVFVAARRWPNAPDDFPSRLAALLDQTIERFGVRAVFLAFQAPGAGADDAAMHRAIADRMRRRDAALHLDGLDHNGLLCALAGARAGIGMRLHASILANSFGVPTIGIAYDPKIRAHYRQVGRDALAFGLDFQVEAAEAALADLLVAGKRQRTDIQNAIAPLKRRAESMTGAFDQWLEGLPARLPARALDLDSELADLRTALGRTLADPPAGA